jgi:hypothetical protein
MDVSLIDEAVTWLEKANADLEPELLDAEGARRLLGAYARAEKLAAFGKTVLADRVADAPTVARATGTSVAKAQATDATAEALRDADVARDAFKGGELSGDQATEIAWAEQVCPGAGVELVAVAGSESFQVLRERARKIVLESHDACDLGTRQHAARSARAHTDELGMIHIDLALEPHLGPRSSTGPRPRPPGFIAGPNKTVAPRPSSATSPTPTRPCWRARARAGPGGPS